MDVSDDFEEEPVECPGKSDFGLLLVFQVLKIFSLFGIYGETFQADCLKIERNIDKHFTENKKETTIKDFLKL